MTPPPPTERRHDIDALRALAFALVILYHLGMYYVAGWPWHLKSPHAAEWLRWPMALMNLWRMDLVFLISGVSLGFLARSRPPGALLRSRAWRLLLPLAFGMAVVVPWQAYAQGVANGFVAPGFGAFLLRYLGGGPHWPAAAFDGADIGITWNHLWYLPYLFAYTAVVVLLLPVLRARAGERAAAAVRRLRGGWLLVLPALPLAAYVLWLAPRYPATHDLLHDGYLHPRYFTFFLYGWWLATDAGLWRDLARIRWAALGLALLSAALLVAGREGLLGAAGAALAQALRAVYGWAVVAAVLGFGHRHLNRPWPWLRWANESVYPWYVLHQTLILLAAVWLAPLALGPVAEPAAILAATVSGCWLLNDGLIRRLRVLRPLFGLPPRRPQPQPRAASQAPMASRGTW
ncbi:Acyltransferase family protein [Xylophilus ampelinus]|nr:acyltransferase family protein [Variovorax sp.]VTY37011.1 Acyltransferase family protein [Xylophilus ampelinus]